MIPFASLHPVARAWLALWALLLCLTNLGSAALAAARSRFPQIGLAALLLLPIYGIWQVMFDLSLFGTSEKACPLTIHLTGLPWLGWFSALVLLTAASGLLLGYHIRYDRTFITPGTIKVYLDQVPCGVCCWRDSGRVLFSNDCMNRLCEALTGSSLLNGNQFRDAVPNMVSVDGRMWRFSMRDYLYEGAVLHEMIASDVTVEYAKTQTLERDKAELLQLNREKQEYYLSIDDLVRRQEILQARVRIHDEMNSLMLSTTAAKPEDLETLNRLFSLWEQNALLLCREAEDAQETSGLLSLKKLAEALNISLIWQKSLPEGLTEGQRRLFFAAGQEAIVNAAKHAQAKTMTISFESAETALCCRFSNDGTMPEKPVAFTGGLANLSLLAQRQGASVTVDTDGAFTLVLQIPKQPSTP